jgi:hypothetical protein
VVGKHVLEGIEKSVGPLSRERVPAAVYPGADALTRP